MSKWLSTILCMIVFSAAIVKESAVVCRTEIIGDEAFLDIRWEKVFEDTVLAPMGIVQSVCATEHYIICIENTADDPNQPDTVSAYYRNGVDENGNPVEPYSLARRVTDMDWEHGNGMAYNPNTGEIYVALYTNTHGDNGGCIYVMDPNTLTLTRKIQVSDSYNILGIGYLQKENQYVIQADAAGEFRIKILDENFQLLDDQGPADPSPGYNFQDLCVSGDYVMHFPLTYGLGVGEYLYVYSLGRKVRIASVPLEFQEGDVAKLETESICELEPGVFLAIVNVEEHGGERKCCFYKMTRPYYFDIQVSGENGRVSEGSSQVMRGSSFSVQYEANPGYELSSIIVDGAPVDIEAYPESYTWEDVQADHTVDVKFIQISADSSTEAKSEEGQPADVSGKPAGSRLWILAVIVSLAAILTGWYLFVLHVRRERQRKRDRARRERQRLRWERDREAEKYLI